MARKQDLSTDLVREFSCVEVLSENIVELMVKPRRASLPLLSRHAGRTSRIEHDDATRHSSSFTQQHVPVRLAEDSVDVRGEHARDGLVAQRQAERIGPNHRNPRYAGTKDSESRGTLIQRNPLSGEDRGVATRATADLEVCGWRERVEQLAHVRVLRP